MKTMNPFKRLYATWYGWRVRLHKRHYLLGALVHFFSIIFVAFILVVLFTLVILQPYHVQGESMEPTLSHGDRLFIFRLSKIKAQVFGQDYVPQRGQIVVLHDPVSDDKWIKRVVGLPNERIVLRDNTITIYNNEFPNGFEPVFNLDPPLPDFPHNEPVIDRFINAREIFVIGDNRHANASSDSRGQAGNISLDNVDGSVIIRVIPFFNFRFF